VIRPRPPWLDGALAAGVSLAGGAGAAWCTWLLAPDRLDVETDIIGYPIHSDFNVYRYVWAYVAAVLVLPGVAAALFVGLSRVGPWRRTGAGTEDASEPEVGPIASGGPGHRAAVAVVVSLELLMILRDAPRVVDVVVVAFALAWIAAPSVVPSLERAAATVHLAMAPVVVLGVALASTRLQVLETGGVTRSASWLPVPVGVAAAVLVGVVVLLRWRRLDGEPAGALERGVVIWVFGSVFVFLCHLSVPSTAGVMDTFHEGEFLAAARLTADGRVPWRDLYTVHGLLQDALFPLVGFHLFEPTRWGSVAGTTVVLLPAYWAVVWGYVASFVRHHGFLLAVAALLLASDLLPHHHMRFVLAPIAFLLLRRMLEHPSVQRAGVFIGALAIQAVLVPESAFVVVVALVAVVLFDVARRNDPAFGPPFRRTLLCAGAGLGWSAAILLILASKGALGPFLTYVRGVSRGHVLTGGIPIQWDQVGGRRLPLPVLAPVVPVIASVAYVAVKVRRRERLTIVAWVLLAHVGFVALYFTKFLDRADAHIYQVVGVALPMLLATGGRVLDALWRAATRLVRTDLRVPSGLAVVLGLAVFGSAMAVAGDVRGPMVATGQPSPVARLGYATPDAIDPNLLDDVRRVTDGVLGADGTLFDFSNNPAVFEFLLGLDPPTRYYHVSLAIRDDAQRELIDDLEAAKPMLIAYHHDHLGLPTWDGIPNEVRHDQVSAYLLGHYRPYGLVAGFTFLVRSDLRPPSLSTLGPFAGPASEEGFLRGVPACTWGAAPQFLVDETSGRARSEVAPTSVEPVRTFRGWARDPRLGHRVRMVLAVRGGAVVARADLGKERPDVGTDDESRTTGFDLVVRGENLAPEVSRSLRVFAVTDDGTASELPMGAGTGIELEATRPSLPGVAIEAETFRAEPGVVDGQVEGFDDEWVATYDLTPQQHAATRWIGFGRLAPGERSLETELGSVRSAITFESTRGDRSFVLPVDNCPQWHWAGQPRLYLRSARREPLTLALVGP
jgi:hypothetical protein